MNVSCDAAVAELGEDAGPELGAFAAGRADPHPEHVAFTVEVDAHGHVDRPVGDLAVADLDDDGVDQDHRVDGVERPVLPATMSSTTASVIRLIVSREMSVS